MKITVFCLVQLFLISFAVSQWTYETTVPYDSNRIPILRQIAVIDSTYSFLFGNVMINENFAFPYFAKRNLSGWQHVQPNLNTSIRGLCFTATDSLNMWLGTFHPDEIYHSSDAGLNWVLQIHVADTGHIQGMMFCKSNPNIGYAYASIAANTFWNGISILKTTNAGANWFKWDFINYGYFGGDNCICVTDSVHVWVGAANALGNNKKIYMTTNGGENWLVFDVNVGLGGPYTIQFSSDNKTGIFSGQVNPTNWFFRTTNSGQNWSIVYTTSYYYSLTMRWIPGTSNIYGNSEFVTVKSTDNGLNWTTMTGSYQTLKSMDVIMLNQNSIYGLLATSDRKIYKLIDTNVIIGVNNNQNTIPDEFILYQNYPNPFNPVTKINYALPNKSNVTIKVFDILGRLVKTLLNETKEAGYFTVSFDGTGLASGVYFYTIEAGNFKDSKKMVLIK